MSNQLTLSIDNWQAYERICAPIRRTVFIEEQGVSEADELDNADATALHVAGHLNDQPVVCARLLCEPDNTRVAAVHIGRVAVLAEYRGRGLGHDLMQWIIALCHARWPNVPVYLYAQVERQGFYQALGFVAHGDIFMDAGIEHIAMYYQTDVCDQPPSQIQL